jgi:drug/metabolite transporter (DMT)-like permease
LQAPIQILHVIAIVFGMVGLVLVAQPDFIFPSSDVSAELARGSLEYITVVLVCLAGAIFAALVYILIQKSNGNVHHLALTFSYALSGGAYENETKDCCNEF